MSSESASRWKTSSDEASGSCVSFEAAMSFEDFDASGLRLVSLGVSMNGFTRETCLGLGVATDSNPSLWSMLCKWWSGISGGAKARSAHRLSGITLLVVEVEDHAADATVTLTVVTSGRGSCGVCGERCG